MQNMLADLTLLLHKMGARRKAAEVARAYGAGVPGDCKESHDQEGAAAGNLAQGHAGLQRARELLPPHRCKPPLINVLISFVLKY